MIFRRSAVSNYKDSSGGPMAMLRFDSTLLRIVIFLAMSGIFFLFFKVTSRNLPDVLAPDSLSDTTTVVTHGK